MTHCNLINCKYYHILIIAAMYNTLNNRLHIPLSHYYLLSPSTLFFFFVHLIVFCTSYYYCFSFFFAHPFCTSYCLFAHRIVFLHILLFCTFFISLHILLLFLLFLPHVCPCVMLLYITCILIILHCPLSGPGSITFHF